MDYYLDRIISDPNICHGQPIIKGTRIMVYLILELLESGQSPQQILKNYYPSLTDKDIKACLHYATVLIKNQEVILFAEVA